MLFCAFALENTERNQLCIRIPNKGPWEWRNMEVCESIFWEVWYLCGLLSASVIAMALFLKGNGDNGVLLAVLSRWFNPLWLARWFQAGLHWRKTFVKTGEGNKRYIHLGYFVTKRRWFLLIDEPTNHLVMDGRKIEYLKKVSISICFTN